MGYCQDYEPVFRPGPSCHRRAQASQYWPAHLRLSIRPSAGSATSTPQTSRSPNLSSTTPVHAQSPLQPNARQERYCPVHSLVVAIGPGSHHAAPSGQAPMPWAYSTNLQPHIMLPQWLLASHTIADWSQLARMPATKATAIQRDAPQQTLRQATSVLLHDRLAQLRLHKSTSSRQRESSAINSRISATLSKFCTFAFPSFNAWGNRGLPAELFSGLSANPRRNFSFTTVFIGRLVRSTSRATRAATSGSRLSVVRMP